MTSLFPSSPPSLPSCCRNMTVIVWIRFTCCGGWERQCRACGSRVEAHAAACKEHPGE